MDKDERENGSVFDDESKTESGEHEPHRISRNFDVMPSGKHHNEHTSHDYERDDRDDTNRPQDPVVNKPTSSEPSDSSDPKPETDDTDKPSASSSDSNAPEKPKFNLHKYFLYTLVGGLVIAALISVVAVLIGEFNSTVSRALGTTGSMVLHTLIALFIISFTSQSKSKAGGFLSNTLFVITIASFITTILNIWDIIDGRLAFDLYGIYFYSFLASLWSQLMLKMAENFVDKATRMVSYAAIGFTWLFWLLLIPTILTHYPDKLPEFHYRALAATVIVLATLSVLTIVFRRIYIAKHPELKKLSSTSSRWDVVIALVILILGVPFIFAMFASLASYNYQSDYNGRTSAEIRQEAEDAQKKYSSSDQEETTVGTTYDGNKYTKCAELDTYASPEILEYASTYIYKSHNATEKHIITAFDENSKSDMSPVQYSGELVVVDSKCEKISVDELRKGDKVLFYLYVGYSNFYSDGLYMVQKLD